MAVGAIGRGVGVDAGGYPQHKPVNTSSGGPAGDGASRLPLASAPWEFREVGGGAAWRSAVVPGCVHRDLLRHDLIADPFWGTNERSVQWIEERDWEYRAAFCVPARFLEAENIDLVADGLDTVATVTLNGHEVARTDNMFVEWRWPVRSLLQAGRNELHIRFTSAMDYIRTHALAHQPREFQDPVGRSSVIRKQQCQFGWDWGPRLVTAGIWRDIRLEAWSGNRLENVRVRQHHAADGTVTLQFEPQLARPDPGVHIEGTVSLDGEPVATIDRLQARIERPALWWPAGQGAQPLYTVSVTARAGNGTVVGTWTRRIGLRTIRLDRRPDQWGESFQFLVNGRPVFMKGANWIPAHSFVAGLERADYERDLRAAVAANMNMLRVWGGGIYEHTAFYDLCNELGLLVWQDFMFACTLYPHDDAFLANVRREAVCQVQRLRHHACLALWCGNNEIAQLNDDLLAAPVLRAGYEALFHRLLPEVVHTHDGATDYWPSSQWRGSWDNVRESEHGLERGDTHFWDVWHALRPVKDYEKWAFRFVSEFGMQSYCSPETQATFCPPEEANLFGPVMESHQKNRRGNQIILDYVFRRYRFPRDQEGLIYLSQLNQAHCIQVAVEHYRRTMPRCMGALYWQLNDCWPVASWSSIEFPGRWKALHYHARRFFAPALVSAHVPGDEIAGIGNLRHSTVREAHLYTVYDAPEPATGRLRWDVFHLDGRRLARDSQEVALRPGESVCQHTLDLVPHLEAYGRDRIYLRIALDIAGRCVSEDGVLLAPPRFLSLPRPETQVEISALSPTRASLRVVSPVYQHRFMFELPGLPHHASDNYFDLFPGEPRVVILDFRVPVTSTDIARRLHYLSLASCCGWRGQESAPWHAGCP